MYGKEDRKVRIVGQPRPLTPLMEDLLTKVQGEAGKMGMGNAPAATFASDNCLLPILKLSWPPIGC